MKRKIFTFAAAAALAAVLTVPASAAESESRLFFRDHFPLHIFCGAPCPEQTPSVPNEPDAEDTPSVPAPPAEDTPEQAPVPPMEEETPGIDAMSRLEQEACELVNDRREENGLEPLTISAELSVKARVKSQDMKDNGYFDHNSPTYGSPFELMQSLGITYRSAAENIAMGYRTAEAVVAGWMNSPGHRANILSERYTTMGIGLADGYWTQWFIG